MGCSYCGHVCRCGANMSRTEKLTNRKIKGALDCNDWQRIINIFLLSCDGQEDRVAKILNVSSRSVAHWRMRISTPSKKKQIEYLDKMIPYMKAQPAFTLRTTKG